MIVISSIKTNRIGSIGLILAGQEPNTLAGDIEDKNADGAIGGNQVMTAKGRVVKRVK